MNDKITCPHCKNDFDIETVLSEKIETRYKDQYQSEYKKKIDKLESDRVEFEKKKENENKIFQAKLAQKLSEEKEKITKEVQNITEQKMKTLQKENEEKTEENRALKQKEIDLLQKEKKLKDQTEEMELSLQKQILEKQGEIEEKARAKEREALSLKMKELEKKLEDQTKLAEEMKRKSEQGSMQLQGEVQELALEELLRNTYPFDEIKEVPKGMRGADSIQTVINRMQQKCGAIVYESKRTKAFSNEWIQKLKEDQISHKADIAVLVSETLPKDMDKFGQKNGVWICGFHEVKSLSLVLREMLLKTHSVKKLEENKGEKKDLLYNYLTSVEFYQTITIIAENQNKMLEQLNQEKRAMQKIWKAREKQIETVETNILALGGSIEGLTGKKTLSSKNFELGPIE